MTKKTNKTQAIDQHVGRAIRWYRVQCGLTQQQLAAQLRISYQQLHKYENGSNSVSASMLSDISNVLSINAAALFEGFDATDHWLDKAINQQDMQLAHFFNRIRDPQCRSALVTLVKSLANSYR